jgi:hypothetical protein
MSSGDDGGPSSSCLRGGCSAAEASVEARHGRERQLEEELRRAWRRPVSTTATAKDVPRLATRIDVRAWDDAAQQKKQQAHPNAKRAREQRQRRAQAESKASVADGEAVDAVDGGPERRRAAIIQTVRALASYFGGEEPARAEAAIDAESQSDTGAGAAGRSSGPDLRAFCETLLHGLGLDDSKVVRVLKCCHQNILFIAIMELKMGVLKDIMTKDNRDADGWRIQLKLEEKRVQVTHLRRDRLVSVTPGGPSPGVLSWEVSLTFNREMTRLDSTGLRLTGMSLAPSAEAADRQRLARALSSGSLILR